MKRIILLIASLHFIILPVCASSPWWDTFAEKEKTGYDRLTVGYDALFYSNDYPTLDGVILQYVHGFKIAKIPLFLEIGASAAFNIKYENMNYGYIYGDYIKEKFLNLSFKIPVNLSYRVQMGDLISLFPYTGPYLKINPHQEGFYTPKYINDYNMSEIQYDVNIFQAGWQFGFGFTISKFNIGVQYGLELNPRAKTRISEYFPKELIIKSSELAVSLGINF